MPPSETPRALVGKGMLAGVVGTAAMTAAQNTLLPKIPSGPAPSKEPRYPPEPEAKGEPATETVARRLFEGLAHRHLPKRYQKQAGNLVHFGTGAFWGGLLGLALSRRPSLVDGLVWGAVVWAINDNLVVPLFRVGDWPNRYAPGVHAKGLLAHLIYGAGTALALRASSRLR